MLQIASEEKPRFMIGDNGTMYFYYDKDNKEWFMHWDCFKINCMEPFPSNRNKRYEGAGNMGFILDIFNLALYIPFTGR